MDFFEGLKSYGYWAYLAIIGYLGWNHKRIDAVITDQAVTRQDVKNLTSTVDHIRVGVDMLTKHLLDKDRKK